MILEFRPKGKRTKDSLVVHATSIRPFGAYFIISLAHQQNDPNRIINSGLKYFQLTEAIIKISYRAFTDQLIEMRG